jgi:hypothetical protein
LTALVALRVIKDALQSFPKPSEKMSAHPAPSRRASGFCAATRSLKAIWNFNEFEMNISLIGKKLTFCKNKNIISRKNI